MMVGFEHHEHADGATEHEGQRPISPEMIAASGTKGHKMVSLPRSFNAPVAGTGVSTSAVGLDAQLEDQGNAVAGPSSLKRQTEVDQTKRKRRRMESSAGSREDNSCRQRSDLSSDLDAPPALEEHADVEMEERKNRKPWKHVYCERLIVERNWRKGRYTERTLKVSPRAVSARGRC
jgi:hypothetical protein